MNTIKIKCIQKSCDKVFEHNYNDEDIKITSNNKNYVLLSCPHCGRKNVRFIKTKK